MIDKEKIIIGGVDVSKCRFLDVEKDKEDYPEMGGRYTAYECILTSNDCECSKDCYYKQLKRKTQECDCYRKALEEIEKKCCAVLNGDEKILYAYKIKEIIDEIKENK